MEDWPSGDPARRSFAERFMAAVAIGPFLISGDKLALLFGAGFLALALLLLAWRVDRRIGLWAVFALPLIVIAARIGHVAAYPSAYAGHPLRVVAIWDGGLLWQAGLAAGAVFALVRFAEFRLRAWTIGTLAASALVGNIVWQLVAITPAVAAPVDPLPVYSGGEKSLRDFGGKPTVVNFWATWCPPCRREMPMLAAAAAERKDVNFVFANQSDGPEKIRSYLASTGLTLDNILVDPQTTLSRHYSIKGYPATLFLDPQGVAQKVHFGEIDRKTLDEQLTAMSAR